MATSSCSMKTLVRVSGRPDFSASGTGPPIASPLWLVGRSEAGFSGTSSRLTKIPPSSGSPSLAAGSAPPSRLIVRLPDREMAEMVHSISASHLSPGDALGRRGEGGRAGSGGGWRRMWAPPPRCQKRRVHSGSSTEALTAIIPTPVSRKPQRLILMTEGAPERVWTARTRAVEIMKRPERRRRQAPILRPQEMRRRKRRGAGMQRMARSVPTLRTTRVQKFCGRKVHSGPGRGLICQLR